jgi:type I restriction enzyme M protein
VLFIDARKLDHKVDRTHRELADEDVARIADTYHAWRSTSRRSRESGNPVENGGEAAAYGDMPGFCKSASLDEVRKHGHVLTPGRYVGALRQEDNGEPCEQ